MTKLRFKTNSDSQNLTKNLKKNVGKHKFQKDIHIRKTRDTKYKWGALIRLGKTIELL